MSVIFINPYRFAAATAYDPDALAYITAVETADGQALETGVKNAINAFVVGCKADGIWSAIKASCILAGARTLNGALVPLVGTAPTNFNFVSGDYNRKTGLIGNGSTKYLDSNRANNADPQNNQHMAAVISSGNVEGAVIGAGGPVVGATHIFPNPAFSRILYRNRNVLNDEVSGQQGATGLVGMSRSSSSSFVARSSGVNTTFTRPSETPDSSNISVFARSATTMSSARLAFYSIGESLNLALLDARVTALMYEIQKTLLEGDFDIDAAAYISRVETADGQDLEPAVRTAINNFVVGCKADGIWSAIKASCILAGARTLSGALVPLAGAAPTNFNFVSGDYNRKTGLTGNGSTKYLNSNRNNNADPQNSNHNATYITGTGAAGGAVIAGGISNPGDNYIDLIAAIGGARHSNRNAINQTNGTYSFGFLGTSRSSNTQYSYRVPGDSGTRILPSQTPSSAVVTVFARDGGASSFSDHRLAFYSIGESLNLALLDSRVTTLINAIAAAIP